MLKRHYINLCILAPNYAHGGNTVIQPVITGYTLLVSFTVILSVITAYILLVSFSIILPVINAYTLLVSFTIILPVPFMSNCYIYFST